MTKSIWRFLRLLCLGLGSLIGLLAAALIAIQIVLFVAEKTSTYQLPSGVYVKRITAFSSHDNSTVWRPDNTPIHDKPLRKICFNEKYVMSRNVFIYDIKQDTKIPFGAPRYEKMLRESGLVNENGYGCNISFGDGKYFDQAIEPGQMLLFHRPNRGGKPDWLRIAEATFSD